MFDSTKCISWNLGEREMVCSDVLTLLRRPKLPSQHNSLSILSIILKQSSNILVRWYL